jgi:succinate dehydrogenase / fumarate reductase flavoprotein subunit
VAQGVPFAREYGGLLDNRSFGGAQVSRTFYARGQTGQQLLLGAYQALARQVHLGTVELYPRTEMLDLVLKDGHTAGIVTRDLVSGELRSWSAHAVVLATGGYGNVFYLSTNAKASNVTAIWRAHKKGALMANPCYTQIHPTCIPRSDDFQSKLTLMSESLRNDGRVWVPATMGDTRSPDQIPDRERDYFLERRYPAFGNLVPRDVASRAAKHEVDAGRGVGPQKNGVYLDFGDAIARLGHDVIEERYGNLFEMYERITDEDPYQVPMRIYPAVHYTMGGLWVDYNLMSNVPGLYVLGEANFSDHGANRLGASALMQGLADGYFVLPATISDYLAPLLGTPPVPTDDPVFRESEAAVVDQVRKLTSTKGTRSVDYFHRALGDLLWDNCGMARSRESLEKALSDIPALREEFHADVRVLGEHETLNQSLEKAGRVSDFLEFGELLCRDALHREESCGGHFRVEHQTEDGEALRDDEHFSYVGAWEFNGVDAEPTLHQEPLEFEYVHLAQRSYK